MAARERRDTLRKSLKKVWWDEHALTVETFPTGSLAQGTQIKPLDDVDVVVTLPSFRGGWCERPQTAREELQTLLEKEVPGQYSFSTHAIQIKNSTENFTSDVLLSVQNASSPGIWIPHCPKNGDHKWIQSHPAEHRELVKERNRRTDHMFAREVRILKWLNRKMKEQTPDNRKPISSFHLVTLALELLPKTSFSHATATADFLEDVSERVKTPIEDPSGVGADLVAKDPAAASRLFAEAAWKTREAETIAATDMQKALLILKGVFGDVKLMSATQLSVGSAGTLLGDTTGRDIPPVRAYGEEK